MPRKQKPWSAGKEAEMFPSLHGLPPHEPKPMAGTVSPLPSAGVVMSPRAEATAPHCAICDGKGEIHAHWWVMPHKAEPYWRPFRDVGDSPPHMRHLLREEAPGLVWKRCLVCGGSGVSPRARAFLAQPAAPPTEEQAPAAPASK